MAVAIRDQELGRATSCQHENLSRASKGDKLSRVECDDCPYVFWIDNVLYERMRVVLERKRRK